MTGTAISFKATSLLLLKARRSTQAKSAPWRAGQHSTQLCQREPRRAAASFHSLLAGHSCRGEAAPTCLGDRAASIASLARTSLVPSLCTSGKKKTVFLGPAPPPRCQPAPPPPLPAHLL